MDLSRRRHRRAAPSRRRSPCQLFSQHTRRRKSVRRRPWTFLATTRPVRARRRRKTSPSRRDSNTARQRFVSPTYTSPAIQPAREAAPRAQQQTTAFVPPPPIAFVPPPPIAFVPAPNPNSSGAGHTSLSIRHTPRPPGKRQYRERPRRRRRRDYALSAYVFFPPGEHGAYGLFTAPARSIRGPKRNDY